ncbi:hypothetical protein MW887_006005 [Aspergillus wentii]|nr:hypothetical protein MW887_006005 [Aspergillus wentii]
MGRILQTPPNNTTTATSASRILHQATPTVHVAVTYHPTIPTTLTSPINTSTTIDTTIQSPHHQHQHHSVLCAASTLTMTHLDGPIVLNTNVPVAAQAVTLLGCVRGVGV